MTERATGWILHLDTSAPELMLGLGRLENPALDYTLALPGESQRYHSAILIPEIRNALDTCGISISDLAHLAVHVGPGSFTGIRTGLISARTLGQFLPACQPYAIDAFSLWAHALAGERVDVALDARRDRVFHARLSVGETLAIEAPGSLKPLDELPNDGCALIAPASLIAALPARAGSHVIEDLLAASKTPERMHALIRAHGPALARRWDLLLPLYIEAPNITLSKKNKPGAS